MRFIWRRLLCWWYDLCVVCYERRWVPWGNRCIRCREALWDEKERKRQRVAARLRGEVEK